MEFIPAKTIISGYAAENGWFGINYNMNIYKGCCHGCIYCDSRSGCYHVENFDTVRAKENALEIIANDLKHKTRLGTVGTGSMSDPYNPFERTEMLTRNALDLLDKYNFGAAIATKSDLILRDIDILQNIKFHSPVLCKLTITTADDALCRKIEPNVSPSSSRFKALSELAKAGIYAGILMMPILPFLEDTEENILQIVERAHESGAKFIFAGMGVTLRQNQRDWYYEKLVENFPNCGLVQKYKAQFGEAYNCESPNKTRLWNAFTEACDKRKILYRMPQIIRGYKSEVKPPQLSMF